MSRKPTVLSLGQLQEAAQAAVAIAMVDRTIALTEEEARGTSGGALEPIREPTLMGARPVEPLEPFAAF